MKINVKILIVFISVVFLIHYSTPNLYPGWFKHYGGANGDYANCIQQTSDSGYIVGGYTTSYTYGGYDFSIYKLDSDGNKQWYKHYGGTNGDIARSIRQTSDGGYIIAGHSESYSNGGEDFAIYKLDSSGTKVWFKHYGGTLDDTARSIQQTSDGGYIVAGYTYSYSHGKNDFALYKLDSNGNKVWFKHYGGSEFDQAYSIQQTSDGGYVVAGYSDSYSYGSSDFAIYKLDSSGSKVWFKHYGGTQDDECRSIQQTNEGGYIAAGDSESYSYGYSDFAIYKLSTNGNKIWFKHYGGSDYDLGWSVRQTSDVGYIVAGYTKSYTYGDNDFAIYKLSSSGSKIWFKHYGGTNIDKATSVQKTSDGGYIVGGHTTSYTHGDNDFAIYKLDSNGDK